MTLTPKLKNQIYKAVSEKDTPLFADCMEIFEKLAPGFELTAIQLVIDNEEGNMYIADFVKLVNSDDYGAPETTPDYYHMIWSFWTKEDALRHGLISSNWENQDNNQKAIDDALSECEDEY